MDTERSGQNAIRAIDIGIRDLAEAGRIVGSTIALRARDDIPDVLLFTLHPRSFEWGPETSARLARLAALNLSKRLKSARVESVQVATAPVLPWHWPGQIVVHPVLATTGNSRGGTALAAGLEQAAVETLRAFRVEAFACRESPLRSTLWFGGRQVGASGLNEEHGVAAGTLILNLDGDHSFSRLGPDNGLAPNLVTLREILGAAPPRPWVAQAVRKRFALALGRPVDEASETLILRVCGPDPKCVEPARRAAR
jgi:lipoate-protein ligase B